MKEKQIKYKIKEGRKWKKRNKDSNKKKANTRKDKTKRLEDVNSVKKTHTKEEQVIVSCR